MELEMTINFVEGMNALFKAQQVVSNQASHHAPKSHPLLFERFS